MEETLSGIAASGLPLQGELDAFKAEFETRFAPLAVVAIMHRVTDELIASGPAQRALRAGDRAPTFKLPDRDGKMVSSRDLLVREPIVLTFYRGFWCPYCNFDLTALEMAGPEIEKRGARLVAVSQQTAANSRKSQRANNLGFPILGDQGGALAQQFGADLEAFNGDDSWTLPMPARYVVGQDGVIAYSDVNPDYTRRPEPSNVFPVLEALRANKAA